MKTIPMLLLAILLSGCSSTTMQYQINRGVDANATIRDIVRQISEKHELEEEKDLQAQSNTIIYSSNLGLFSMIAIRAYSDQSAIIVSLREGKLGASPSDKYDNIKNELTRKLKDAFGDKVIFEDSTDNKKNP
jgi:hypothetical protein